MGIKAVHMSVVQHYDSIRFLDAGDALRDDDLGRARNRPRKGRADFGVRAVSTALVESSRIRILGRLSSARAMHSRCFCPPETFAPPRSMRVW